MSKVEMQDCEFYPNYISEEQEKGLVKLIDEQEWDNSLARRTLQYGYRYDYNRKQPLEKIEDGILNKLKLLLLRYNLQVPVFAEDGSFESDLELDPNCCIVNEYVGSQGIGAHVDADCFGETIAILSLNADTQMRFTHVKTGESMLFEIPRRSLLILRGDSRWEWKHEIQPRKRNGRRISLTFRTAI